MGRNRFVLPEVVRIPLSEGDWIEVKKDLNTGDQKLLESVGMMYVKLPDGTVTGQVDWEVYELRRAMIFLKDWSFRDEQDKPVALKTKEGLISIDALRALDVPSFAEVNAAILKHVVERTKEKKAEREARETPPPATEPVSDQPST